MLTWPHAQNDWAKRLTEVEKFFIQLTREISLHELCLIVCFDNNHRQRIEYLLIDAQVNIKNLRFGIAASNDVWARDHGPITIFVNGEIHLLDFRFNGWGNKYPAALDNRITAELGQQKIWGHHPLQSIDFVLEGGSIETDGQGTLLVTSSCLLTPNRNPGMGREQIDQHLKQYFNLDNVLWLSHGQLTGDDTGGHIDTLARFCDKNTIAYVACEDPEDEHYDSLRQMKLELKTFLNHSKQAYGLVPLPLPSAKLDPQGKRLPATYANFLIINNAVLVPTYNDTEDANALDTLQSCFPDRKIIGIDCSPLIQQFGSLHCVTMQLPVGVLN